ncbi:MAG: caspase family protein [Rhizobiaceae bacterium]
MRSIRTILSGALLLFAALGTTAEAADQRPMKGVALVIGQSRYEALPELPNPANDARAVDRLLSDLGFDVNAVLDGDRRKLERALQRFAEDAADADVALVYYSGHGVEAAGENYIVPVDARLPGSGGAVDDLVPVGFMLAELQRTVPITIVLLDACRNNPYPPGATVAKTDGGTAPVASIGLGEQRGAAPLSGQADAPIGTVIGFAAEPGRAALDGEPGGNSPYAAAVLKHLGAGGYAFGDVMTLVAEEVYLKTSGRQLPWVNASLRRLLYFGLDAEPKDGDEQAIRSGRRTLLLTIATTPPERRHVVEAVAAAKAVPLDGLYGMLGVLGVDASDGDLEEQLSKGAERLKIMLASRDVQARQDAEIVRLAGLADKAEDEGAIALALDFRARASTRADAIDGALDEAEANIVARRHELAATYRSHAETASLNFDFATAARRFGDAFEQVKKIDPPLAYQLKVLEGEALSDQGIYRGENAALQASVEAYGAALQFGRDSPDLRRDGSLLAKMALVKTQMATRVSSMDAHSRLIEAALADYRQAAELLGQSGDPADLALLYLNLGGLYEVKAGVSSQPSDFQSALDIYRQAASILTREAAPLEWAGLQMNMGNVSVQLGSMGGGVEAFRTAREAIEAALTVWTRDAYPTNWALAQANLATALRALGDAEQSPDLLREAIAAHEHALEVTTRDRQPTSWASDMTNLGSAYLDLADMQGEPALYRKAIDAYRAAREVLTIEVDAGAHVATLLNEARALLALGRGTDDAEPLKEAMATLDQALEIVRQMGNPIGWARGRSQQGEVLEEMGRLTGDRALLKAARDAFEEARTLYRDNGMGETGQDFWAKKIAALDQELGR